MPSCCCCSSLLTQVGVVVLAFLSHHQKRPDFGCCNAWAAGVATLIIVFQLPYLVQWGTYKGDDVAWHRGNLFVPWAVIGVSIVEWAMGVISMLAAAIGIDAFQWLLVNNLNLIEAASFVICSASGVISIVVLVVLDYSHRNAIGDHYYYVDESSKSNVWVKDKPTENRGYYQFKFLSLIVKAMQLDTVSKAMSSWSKWVVIGMASQVVFYVFACIAYTQKQDSFYAPLGILTFGLIVLVYGWRYSIGSQSVHTRKNRSWHRGNLLVPSLISLITIAVYLLTMSNLFFKTSSYDLWDAISLLDSEEKALFGVSIGLIIALILVESVVALFHLGHWATERLTGYGSRDPFVLLGESAIMGVTLMASSIDPSEIKEKPVDTRPAIPDLPSVEELVARAISGDPQLAQDSVVVRPKTPRVTFNLSEKKSPEPEEAKKPESPRPGAAASPPNNKESFVKKSASKESLTDDEDESRMHVSEVPAALKLNVSRQFLKKKREAESERKERQYQAVIRQQLPMKKQLTELEREAQKYDELLPSTAQEEEDYVLSDERLISHNLHGFEPLQENEEFFLGLTVEEYDPEAAKRGTKK